jgi:hypothetical protein
VFYAAAAVRVPVGVRVPGAFRGSPACLIAVELTLAALVQLLPGNLIGTGK